VSPTSRIVRKAPSYTAHCPFPLGERT
jgi:hypothetical protein